MGFIVPGNDTSDVLTRLVSLGIILGVRAFVAKNRSVRDLVIVLSLLSISMLSLIPGTYRYEIITAIFALVLGYAVCQSRAWEAPLLILGMISLPLVAVLSPRIQHLFATLNTDATRGNLFWLGIVVGLMIAGLVPFAYIVVRKKAIEDIVLKLGIAQGIIGWFLYTVQPQFRCILPFGLDCGFPIAPLIIGLSTVGLGITAAYILRRRLPLLMAIPAIVLLPAPVFQIIHAIVAIISLVWLVLSIGILAVPAGVLVCQSAKRKSQERENDKSPGTEEVARMASE
jgi:hypothetical protein